MTVTFNIDLSKYGDGLEYVFLPLEDDLSEDAQIYVIDEETKQPKVFNLKNKNVIYNT